MREVWKWHPEHVGMYKVSNLGRVKSVERVVNIHHGSTRIRPESILSPNTTKDGYLTVAVFQPGGKNPKTRPVHTLVIESFKGPRPFPDAVVRHIDGDQKNNTPRNLVWGTHAENVKDRTKHGRNQHMKGATNGNANHTEAEIKKVWKLLKSGISVTNIVEQSGVSRSAVYHVRSGSTWNHVTGLDPRRT